jgi:hypothetical protein
MEAIRETAKLKLAQELAKSLGQQPPEAPSAAAAPVNADGTVTTDGAGDPGDPGGAGGADGPVAGGTDGTPAGGADGGGGGGGGGGEDGEDGEDGSGGDALAAGDESEEEPEFEVPPPKPLPIAGNLAFMIKNVTNAEELVVPLQHYQALDLDPPPLLRCQRLPLVRRSVPCLVRCGRCHAVVPPRPALVRLRTNEPPACAPARLCACAPVRLCACALVCACVSACVSAARRWPSIAVSQASDLPTTPPPPRATRLCRYSLARLPPRYRGADEAAQTLDKAKRKAAGEESEADEAAEEQEGEDDEELQEVEEGAGELTEAQLKAKVAAAAKVQAEKDAKAEKAKADAAKAAALEKERRKWEVPVVNPPSVIDALRTTPIPPINPITGKR